MELLGTQLKVSRKQTGELERGKELLTIAEMQAKGFSQNLVLALYILAKAFFSHTSGHFQVFESLASTNLRAKVDAIIRKQQGVPDPDAPCDAASTRFWCFTGGKFTDREATSIEMEATANVETSAASLGSMFDVGSSAGGTPTLALTNGEAVAAPSATTSPSLGDLVTVMQGHVAAKAKAKATSKAKAKAKSVQQQGQKTPQEIREAIRPLPHVLACFAVWAHSISWAGFQEGSPRLFGATSCKGHFSPSVWKMDAFFCAVRVLYSTLKGQLFNLFFKNVFLLL